MLPLRECLVLGAIFLLCDVSSAAKKPQNQDVAQLTEALTTALKELANGRKRTQIIMLLVTSSSITFSFCFVYFIYHSFYGIRGKFITG